MKRQKDITLKDEPTMSIGVQYATGEEWRNSCRRMKRLNQSRNNAQLWMCQVVKVVWCCKEQYCIGTWNTRSMNQGKLEVIK